MVGAGPVGMAAARAAVEDGIVERLTMVVDPSVDARTRAARELGAEPLASLVELPAPATDGVAVVAYSSHAALVSPALIRLVGLGYHAVTTCEELADPTGELAGELTASAKAAGRSLIVTGANPGFAMDRLPLLLAASARRVMRVEAHRRLDTRARRRPLVEKTGYGLTPAEFTAGVEAGRLGHVGLEVSARLLAEGLGWPPAPVASSIEPVLGGDRVTGLHQTASLESNGRSILLDLTMAWGILRPRDLILVDGDPPLRVELSGGYHGDLGTTAQVLTALRLVRHLPAGFYRPTDLPLRLPPL